MEFQHFDYKIYSCYENMAIDEVLLNSLNENSLPIIRFYSFKPSLTFGKFSNVDDLIDIKHLKNSKICYTRRVTGGGVLTHHIDLSYSIFLPKRFIKNRGVKENYRYLCSFLINLYKNLGFEAKFANELNLKAIKSDICLAGIEEYDIVIDKKKIGGNAQRYTKKGILQHGSIPLWIDKKLFKPLFLKDEIDKSTNLKEIGAKISLEELIDLAKYSFKKTFNIKYIDSKLTTQQEKEVKKLIEEKYSKDSWNLKGIENDK